MLPRLVEFHVEQATQKFDKCPEAGDTFQYNGTDVIIIGVDVVNNSKLVLKLSKKRDTKKYDDLTDSSTEWEEFDSSFFNDEESEGKSNEFIESNTLKEK